MPYALFENDERMTPPFRTEREVWEAAERADLITFGTHGEKLLDDHFEIKPCEAAPGEIDDTPPDIIIPPRREESRPDRNASTDPRLQSPQDQTRERSS